MSLAGPRSVVEYVSGGPPLSEVKNGPAMATTWAAVSGVSKSLRGLRRHGDGCGGQDLVEQDVEVAGMPRLDRQDRAGRRQVVRVEDVRRGTEIGPDTGVLQGLRRGREGDEVGLVQVDEAGLGPSLVAQGIDQERHVGVLVALDRLELPDVLVRGTGWAGSSGCPTGRGAAARKCRHRRRTRGGAADRNEATTRRPGSDASTNHPSSSPHAVPSIVLLAERKRNGPRGIGRAKNRIIQMNPLGRVP